METDSSSHSGSGTANVSHGDSDAAKSTSGPVPRIDFVQFNAALDRERLEAEERRRQEPKGKEPESPPPRPRPGPRIGIPVHEAMDRLASSSKTFDDETSVGPTVKPVPPGWDLSHLMAFEGFEAIEENFLPPSMKTQLVKAMEDVRLLHKENIDKCGIGPHLFQEFVVFCYAYVPFGIALVTSWLCYKYGALDEAQAKLLAGFMGGFGDILNAKMLHDVCRYNKTVPTSQFREQVDKQVLLARDKIRNAVAKAVGALPDKKTQAKDFPLGKLEFVLNEVAAYISDGLPLIFFAIYLVLGAPIDMDVSRLIWSLVLGSLLSGVGVAVVMAMRMITECIAHQPPYQALDTEGCQVALQTTLQDVLDHLRTEYVRMQSAGAPLDGIEEVIKKYEERLAEFGEVLKSRPAPKPTTIAQRWRLFTKDVPLSIAQVTGHTFGFMMWPILAYYVHTGDVAAAIIGCGLGMAGRQEWAYPIELMLAVPQGIYRGIRECCRHDEDQADAHAPKKADVVVDVSKLIEGSRGEVSTILPPLHGASSGSSRESSGSSKGSSSGHATGGPHPVPDPT